MTQTTASKAAGWLGEVSGAVADFGTFLPLVIGVLAVRGFDGTGVLTGFGLFALAVALVYRRPIPIQPMKAVAALIIVGAVTPAEAMASGLIIGGVLMVLAVTGIITRIARLVPGSVIMGVQLGVGAQLALLGFRHMWDDPLFGGAALALLLLLFLTPYRHLGSLVVVVTAAAALLMTGGGFAVTGPGLHLPALSLPGLADFQAALTTTALPQLALTLSNAVLATSAIAAEYFPDDARVRTSPRRLALSTGVLNVVLAPFGALPMCHGSGGLIAQYRFGARTWAAPALFGLFCLALGIGFGPQARDLLMLVPVGAVGAILAVAGSEMAVSRKILGVKPSCRAVILLTGVVCVGVNMAAGLIAGLAAEALRGAYLRRRGETPGT
ncbi:MAG: putative sulfate/molybdate transporter [Rhodospirillales bacterium]|tara:strand:+ start:1148 stop:2296 length:1149 start_codon:yes stop_codon:yes gene_type:complete